ncbi:MAG TPA: hypothetical protein GX707_20940 [Epulopiscium sp.]|nr:hypothetical protein [Candidatus Epulonipiscium sp.]
MKIYRITYLLGEYGKRSTCIVSKSPRGNKGLIEMISIKHNLNKFDRDRLKILKVEEINKDQLFLENLTFSEFIILLESVV